MKSFYNASRSMDEKIQNDAYSSQCHRQPSQQSQFRVPFSPSSSNELIKKSFVSEENYENEKLVQFKKSNLLQMSVVIFLESKESSGVCKLCQSYTPIDHWHYFLDNDQPLWIESIPDLVDLAKSCNNCKSTQKSGSGDHFKLCGLCQKVYYCSKKCQVDNWKRHSEQCKKTGSTNINGGYILTECPNELQDRTQSPNLNNNNSNSNANSNRRGFPSMINDEDSKSVDIANNGNGINAYQKQSPKGFNKKVNNNFIQKNEEFTQQPSTKVNFKPEPVKKLPVIELNCGEKYDLMVTYVHDNTDKSKVEFYTTKQVYLSTVLQMTLKLIEKCKFVPPKQIETNKLYFVKHSDGIWYRGMVVREVDLKYQVLFIDFGNSEYIEKTVPTNNFKWLVGTEVDCDKMLPAAIQMFIKNIPNFQQYTFVTKQLQSVMEQATQVKINVDTFNQDLGFYSVSLE